MAESAWVRVRRGYRRLERAVLPAAAVPGASEQLAAKALGSVLIVLLSVLALWFALILPFFVARKLGSALLCLGVTAALVVSAAVLRRGHVRRAIWIFNIALWIWAAVTVLLSGGIRSIALLGFLPGFVTAATLLGQYLATVSCIVFLGFALILALLEMAGIRLPNYFPFPPLTVWISALLTAVVVALPLNQLLRFLRQSLETMERQLKDLEQAARVLRESEAKSRLILESARDGIVLADAETGQVLGINPAAERLCGGRVQLLQELLAAHLGNSRVPAVPGSRDSHGPGLTETILAREDGAHISIELATNSVVGEYGNRLLVGVFRDTSERKSAELERGKLESRLQQAERLETVGRLAGGIAHDFNNLLTVINGFSGMVLARLGPADESRPALEQIRNAGERAGSLTQQLLAFSRKQNIQPRVVDLNAFLRDICPMLQSLLSDDIELSLGLEAPLAPIVADPGQIHQVLMNLAANARDAMPRGGKLKIETRAITINGSQPAGLAEASPGPYVLLAVSDTGTGMDKSVRAHVFEPFFTTKTGKGTGLGLSTVYGIVRQSRGSITVDSEPGKGTTFRIYLPAAAGQAPSIEPASGTISSSGGRETVLVVEDQDNVRRLTVEILASQGYWVLQAANGFDALKVAEQHGGAIDLLVTDIVMPGMTGPDLAHRLQSVRPETRVLFMSGYSEDAIERHGTGRTSAAYVPKPFTPATLIGKVREVLSGREPATHQRRPQNTS